MAKDKQRAEGKSAAADARLEMRKTVERLAGEGKHLAACELLEELAAMSPRNPLIWNDLGVQYEAAGLIEKAFAALRRAQRIDPAYPPVLYNLGKFTLDRWVILGENATGAEQMLAEAIALLNANLDRDPENADGHACIALAYAAHHDERMAEAHKMLALRLRRSNEAYAG